MFERKKSLSQVSLKKFGDFFSSLRPDFLKHQRPLPICTQTSALDVFSSTCYFYMLNLQGFTLLSCFLYRNVLPASIAYPLLLVEIFLGAQTILMFILHYLTLICSLSYCLSCAFSLPDARNPDKIICLESLKNNE